KALGGSRMTASARCSTRDPTRRPAPAPLQGGAGRVGAALRGATASGRAGAVVAVLLVGDAAGPFQEVGGDQQDDGRGQAAGGDGEVLPGQRGGQPAGQEEGGAGEGAAGEGGDQDAGLGQGDQAGGAERFDGLGARGPADPAAGVVGGDPLGRGEQQQGRDRRPRQRRDAPVGLAHQQVAQERGGGRDGQRDPPATRPHPALS